MTDREPASMSEALRLAEILEGGSPQFNREAAAELRRLHAEVVALRADAERWRWLRSEHERNDPVCHLTWKRNMDRSEWRWVNTANLDAAIDSARKDST